MAQVAVCRPPRGKLRVVERLLANGARETRRQLAGRVHIAKENIGNRGPRFDARTPRLKNGRHMLGGPFQLQRPPGEHDQDHWLAGRDHRLQQLFLRPVNPR